MPAAVAFFLPTLRLRMLVFALVEDELAEERVIVDGRETGVEPSHFWRHAEKYRQSRCCLLCQQVPLKYFTRGCFK